MIFTHILGTRPNFIKSSPIINELYSSNQLNYIIHTNQHYDYEMSKIFFDELYIPEPDVHLGIKGNTHAEQTANALISIENELSKIKTDYVVVYGDVNSSLAGALAASKLNIPIIHIESGCRSYDNSMPEEINRKIIDSISSILICTEQSAYDNLIKLGLVSDNCVVAGNTSIDSLYNIKYVDLNIDFDYYLATLHRPFNVDNIDRLHSILSKLNNLSYKVIIPLHPRVKKNIVYNYNNIIFKPPLGYNEFISHIKNSKGVISDSGGVQCETCFLSKPLLTLRPTTEHLITLDYGNKLVDIDGLIDENFIINSNNKIPYVWDGNASKRVVEFILNYKDNK